jgi:hypothetical protein
LILTLTQPDEKGKVPLHQIVGSNNIIFQIEETIDYHLPSSNEWLFMVPDLIVTAKPNLHSEVTRNVFAIELENDIQWDFADSLRQIKKYKKFGGQKYKNVSFEVIVIIPREYERFVPLYKNEEFPVWLWSATRIWECISCGELSEEKGTLQPRCKKCKSQQRLKGIKDYIFESTKDEPSTIAL